MFSTAVHYLMKYVRLSTVLVVLTVLFAGCSGGGVTDTEATPAGTTTGATTGGTTASGGLALTDADTRLRDAGSFTTAWSYSVTAADGTTSSLTQSYHIDSNANRSLQRLETTGSDSGLDIETFVADGTSYSRYGDGDQVQYVSSDQPAGVFETATGYASGYSTGLESDASFVGTETFDGVTVSRYEYDNTDAWSTYNQGTLDSTFETDETVTVTDFTVAVLVDSDNVARLTTWTLTGETESGQTVSVDWRYSVTDVGSTTVEDPDWLADAQAQSS